MLIIKDRGRSGSLAKLAEAIERTEIVPERKRRRIKVELRYLVLGPERFGEVDIANEQQVALVAYRIAKGGVKRPPKGHQAKRRAPQIFELALIGAGTTTAYFLDTLGPAYDHDATIVIGEENPWIRQRGQGISYINHTWRQVGMPSLNETRYGGNESFANRVEFGRAAEATIAHYVRYWEKTTARRITLLRNGCYRVSYGRNGTKKILARRVVFAAGAGAVRFPPEVKDLAVRNRARIIEMNTFIRDRAVQEKRRAGTVVVWGSNAAIDATAAAKVHGWTIGAWIYGRETPPAWLPGTRYLSPPYELDQVEHYPYERRDRIKISDSEDHVGLLKVVDEHKNEVIADGVTYVVYGLGSDDLLSGPDGMMDDSVLEGAELLSPLLDTDGLFGEPLDDGEQPAFLGWQNTSGTFRVFGLSAENYSGVPGGRGPGRIRLDDPRVLALKAWLSGDVLTVGQLTYIRSAIRAVNNYIPGSIEHRVDYSHADVNNLRVHLATRYPDLPEVYAARFISMIKAVRMGLYARLPHGFTETQVTYIQGQLALKQHQIRRGSTNSLHDAILWERTLNTQLRDMTPGVGAEVEQALLKIPEDER